MNTLLNIALGLVLFIFTSITITFIIGWLVLEFTKEDKKMKPKINDFSKKTKITGMGGVGGPIDVIRGKKQTPTNEPREENDPNPTQK